MDSLFRDELAWGRPFVAGQDYCGKVGAFEGAGYRAKGLCRSTTLVPCDISSNHLRCALNLTCT